MSNLANNIAPKSTASVSTIGSFPSLDCHQKRFNKLTQSWPYRAAVKSPLPKDYIDFEDDTADYLADLLPFGSHPSFEDAPDEDKRRVLSCGWLAYNEKTISIESKIISPACMLLLDGVIANIKPQQHQEGISQALVDESFHILLVVSSCQVTRARRDLWDLQIPQFELVNRMNRAKAMHADQWKKILIQLGTAVVSEVLVSDYLRLLSGAPSIQPLHRITTEIHRRDESAHNGLFRSLAAWIYSGLSSREREFFTDALIRPTVWFADMELDVWRSMLKQIKFPNADAMIDDCEAEKRHSQIELDLSSLETLFRELNVKRDVKLTRFEAD